MERKRGTEEGDVATMVDKETLTNAWRWERITVLTHHVRSLSIRDRRILLSELREREEKEAPHVFFPRIGITLGEFAVLTSVRNPKRHDAGHA